MEEERDQSIPPPELVHRVAALKSADPAAHERPPPAESPHLPSDWSHDPNEATGWKTGGIMGAVEGGVQGHFVILQEQISAALLREFSWLHPPDPRTVAAASYWPVSFERRNQTKVQISDVCLSRKQKKILPLSLNLCVRSDLFSRCHDASRGNKGTRGVITPPSAAGV